MEKEIEEIEEKEIITEEDIDESDPENKKYDESRIYYVYKHVRLDNNTCFYIGKGKNGRKDDPNRNPTHDSICKNHEYKVVIFKDKLNEAEAFKLEEDLIRCYVFKMGYGILIKGYMNNNNKFLTNMTWGGEGSSGYKHSEEEKQKMSESMKGEKNPMFGKNPYANKTEDEMKIISEKKSKSMKGKSHPMCGKRKKGKDSPIYGEKNGMWGKPSPRRRSVICITTGETFDSIKEAGNHYKCSHIYDCCKGKCNHAGKLPDGTPLEWKYVEDDDNESKAV